MGLWKLKIDGEFRHLIRPLRQREYAQLEQKFSPMAAGIRLLSGTVSLLTVIIAMKFVCATVSLSQPKRWNLNAVRQLSSGYVPTSLAEETSPRKPANF